MQTRYCVVKDVNRIYGTKYKRIEMKDREKAITVMALYLQHYCSEKRLGRKATAKDYALCWNRGPGFIRLRDMTRNNDAYWLKVNKMMVLIKKSTSVKS